MPNRNKKRRQHYVWRHYLEAWTTDGTLWCRMAANVFPATPVNVASQRDFYRLREMSERDLAVVRALLIEPLNSPVREIAEGWVPHFTRLFEIKAELNRADMLKDAAEAELDEAINDLEEDLHARLESKALPLLRGLRAKDDRLLRDDEDMTYCWFVAAQYFRTPGMLANVGLALQDAPFNAEASFGLIRTIMSTNVGYALWARRSTLRVTFLDAVGDGCLITGDQPIVNTRATGGDPSVPPQTLELYYPLTPSLGVLFDFDADARSTTERAIEDDTIASYNQMIVEHSHRQIYGSNRISVERM